MRFKPVEQLSYKELLEVVKLNRRFLGFSGMANFGDAVSSSRYAMFFGFLGQYVATVKNSEPKLIMHGLEKEFGKTLFSRKLKNDSILLNIVDRYWSMKENDVNTEVDKDIIYYDTKDDCIDFITIPYVEKLNPKFGFNHNVEDVVYNSEYGDLLEAGTYLSRTNSDKGDYDIGIGLNVSGILVSDKHAAEDTVIISESLSKRGEFTTYQTIEGSTGYGSIPLNAFGDDENYKVFKDIGETLDDSVVLATRSIPDATNPGHYISTYSNEHLKSIDPDFDRMYNVNKAGGKIVDIVVLKNPRAKKVASYLAAYEQLDKYAEAYKNYAKQFIMAVENTRKYYPDTPLSHKLHAEMVYLRSVLNERMTKSKGMEVLDLYHFKITIEFTHYLTKGKKVTGLYGNKGVIGAVIPDDDMPPGVDYIMEAKSIAGRMNPAVIFDGTIGTVSVNLKNEIVKTIKDNNISLDSPSKGDMKTIKSLFYKVVNLLKLLELEGYEIWRVATDSEIVETIKHVVDTGRLHFIIPMDSSLPKEEMIYRVWTSEYAPKLSKMKYKLNGVWKETDDNVEVLNTYMLVLSKIGDSWLATSSAHVNHFGVPTGSSKHDKTRKPYMSNPVRTGEAESRLLHAYAGPEALYNLRQRSVDIETHKDIYGQLLTVKDPVNIESVIDTTKEDPYSGDKPLMVFKKILEVGGEELRHKEDLGDILDEIDKGE